MAEYTLRHPFVWRVVYFYLQSVEEEAEKEEKGNHNDHNTHDDDEKEEESSIPKKITSKEVVRHEEGLIINVKYSLKAGNAILVYSPERDVLMELPIKTRVQKIRQEDVTPFMKKINACFQRNMTSISVNSRRLLRVSLSIADEKIAACSRRGNESDSEDDEEDEDEDEEEETSTEEEDASVTSSEEESEDESIDFKVVIKTPSNQEVRGFSVQKSKLIKRVLSILKNDYGALPNLFYIDSDGDEIAVKNTTDLKYVLRSHKIAPVMANFRLNAYIGMKPGEESNIERVNPVESIADSKTSNETLSMKKNNDEGVFDNDNSNENLHWQKGELVGVGSFGQVFGGVLVKTGQRIAVKEVVLHGGTASLDQAKALQVEIQILSALEDHPNVISYMGAEVTSSALRIFLDLASEGSLKEHLNQFGALSEPLLRKYMFDILSGLSFLHSKRIIHRDIKPSNLLLDKGTVKLADFGASATVKLGENDKTELQHDSIIGTAIYMSPEIMRGSDAEFDSSAGYGRSTDIWSLGITFCEMATAKKPFKNAAAAVFCVCVSKQYPSLPPEVSDEAVSFLARCLVDDATARADCKELLAHPFCTCKTSYDNHLLSPSHTFSSVAKLPNFDTISPLLTQSIDHQDSWLESADDDSEITTTSPFIGVGDGVENSRSVKTASTRRKSGSEVCGESTTAGDGRHDRSSRRFSKSSGSSRTLTSKGSGRDISGDLEEATLRKEPRLSNDNRCHVEAKQQNEGQGDVTVRRHSRRLSGSDLNSRRDNDNREAKRTADEDVSGVQNDVTVRRHSRRLSGSGLSFENEELFVDDEKQPHSKREPSSKRGGSHSRRRSGSHINLRFGSNDERLGGSVRQSRRMSGSDLSYKQSEMEFRDHILNIRRLQRAESKEEDIT